MTARDTARDAYALALHSGQRATLPAFVYSVSEFYPSQPNTNKAYDYFAYAVTNEQNTKLLPILFSVFLDRAIYRMNDGGVPHNFIDRIYNLSRSLEFNKSKAIIQQGIVTRYFVLLKLEQQKISSLSGSQSLTIKDNPKTLSDVRVALDSYEALLKTSKQALDDQGNVVSAQIDQHLIHTPNWEKKWLEKISSDLNLWQQYHDGINDLSIQISELERYQASLIQKPTKDDAANDMDSDDGYIIILLLTVLVGIVSFTLIRRRRHTNS